MTAEQIVQPNHSDNQIQGLLVKKCSNIEDKINELRGLITTLNLVFTSESISDDYAPDLFYATQVIKDKFNDLMNILGYEIARD